MSDSLITEDMIDMAKAMAASMSRPMREILASDFLDDLVGDGLLALVKAARGYDPANGTGASFTTFAYRSIRNRFLTQLGHDQQSRNRSFWLKWLDHHVSLEDSDEDSDDGVSWRNSVPGREGDPSELVALRDQVEWLERFLDSILTSREAAAYRLHHGDGMNPQDIGRHLGYSRQRAAQLLAKADLKVRKVMSRIESALGEGVIENE